MVLSKNYSNKFTILINIYCWFFVTCYLVLKNDLLISI